MEAAAGALPGVTQKPDGPGPATRKLHEQLHATRRRYPPILRVSLGIAAGCAIGMAALVAVGFALDRRTGLHLLEFVGVTTLAGPQPAALFAFRQSPPLGLPWVIAMSLLNMGATLFLIVPLAWRGFERLRGVRFIGGAVLSAEGLAMRHRETLARWGLLALVVVAIAPVQGAGVLGAGILGVLMRIPMPRLLTTLALTGAALTVAWALVIQRLGMLLPSGGLWNFLPLVIVLAVVILGAVASARGKRSRFNVQIEKLSWVTPAHRTELGKVGITMTHQLFNANLRRLGRKLDIPADELSRCRSAAELLRLNSLLPEDAERLTDLGVLAIRDLAQARPETVRAALEEQAESRSETKPAPPVPAREVEAWHDEAVEFQAEYRRQRKSGTGPAAP